MAELEKALENLILGFQQNEIDGYVIYSYLAAKLKNCLLYTSPSPRDRTRSRMPSSA